MVARNVGGSVKVAVGTDRAVDLVPPGSRRAVSATPDGVVLVSKAGALRTFERSDAELAATRRQPITPPRTDEHA